jgi:ATP-dependent RNA helicase RhlE
MKHVTCRSGGRTGGGRVECSAMETKGIPQPSAEAVTGGFAGLGVSEPVVAALEEIGFHSPTPIQAAVIPPALAGRDVIGLAETGSGKTAAFSLPLLERTEASGQCTGLVVCPTREIALQTKQFLDVLVGLKGLRLACLIGGVKLPPQTEKLRGGVDLVVATPGRLLDHNRRRNLSLDGVERLVLDEADHMLDLGFLPQMQEILDAVPSRRQTLMFSATLPRVIERLAKRVMSEPLRFDLLPSGRAAEGIDHRLYLVHERDKKKCLVALTHQQEGSTLVFMRRKVDADWACRQLELEGESVARLHSDRSQRQRVAALEGFRKGKYRILVATDLAARGIDVPRCAHIVNFDLPATVEDYVHRSGRTARGALKGVVSSIGTWRDKQMVRDIEAALGEPLPRRVAAGVTPQEERRSTIRGRQRVRRRLM